MAVPPRRLLAEGDGSREETHPFCACALPAPSSLTSNRLGDRPPVTRRASLTLRADGALSRRALLGSRAAVGSAAAPAHDVAASSRTSTASDATH